MEAKEERDGTMAPPPNAEGVEGVEAVLAVTGLTEHQIERFIEYELITSIDDVKAYANPQHGCCVGIGVGQGLTGSKSCAHPAELYRRYRCIRHLLG